MNQNTSYWKTRVFNNNLIFLSLFYLNYGRIEAVWTAQVWAKPEDDPMWSNMIWGWSMKTISCFSGKLNKECLILHILSSFTLFSTSNTLLAALNWITLLLFTPTAENLHLLSRPNSWRLQKFSLVAKVFSKIRLPAPALYSASILYCITLTGV